MSASSPSPHRHELSIDAYFAGIRSRDVAILARALTLIESTHPRHRPLADELLTRLMPFTGQSLRVGITGVPGAGKSTFIEALGIDLIAQGHRLAVLAIDPSSGISGGSILGDKTRMRRLSVEPAAYIRPSPSAGTLGGVTQQTHASLLVCEAAGFDVVLIETVGVGQSETMVADMTDCFVAVMLPGSGDELQGIKRGLLELVDLVVVNKADGVMKEAAQLAAQQYRNVLHGRTGPGGPPTVHTCSALLNEGVRQVWEAIAARHARMRDTGQLEVHRREQNLRWMWTLVDEQLRRMFREDANVQRVRATVENEVREGRLPPLVAARQMVQAFQPT